MYIYIYYLYIYIYVYMVLPGCPAAGNRPSPECYPHPATIMGWPSHLRPPCTPPIPQGDKGVSYTLHHSVYNVLLPMKYLYSSHILATVKVSHAIHTCKPYTYTLSTWYLYNTPPIPQGGAWSIAPHTTYFLPCILVTHYLAPTRPTGGRGV